jgi:ABC-type amino acid transport substrate-binding protein
VGFDIDMAHRLAQELNVKIERAYDYWILGKGSEQKKKSSA